MRTPVYNVLFWVFKELCLILFNISDGVTCLLKTHTPAYLLCSDKNEYDASNHKFAVLLEALLPDNCDFIKLQQRIGILCQHCIGHLHSNVIRQSLCETISLFSWKMFNFVLKV